MTTMTMARRPGRPRGARERHGKCLRRVPFGEGYAAWGRMLGAQIQHVREELDVPVSELAAACGCWESSLHRIESGKAPPTMRRLKQIADALGVMVFDLLPRAS